ncbi:MAG: hypothetical protein HYW86_00405 [Candidatus Roizmanbacteria bacterium]|nr:MAG: hypothetical protein HYW86_00405 [Candidatus Roizmanbacteria bacterium]
MVKSIEQGQFSSRNANISTALKKYYKNHPRTPEARKLTSIGVKRAYAENPHLREVSTEAAREAWDNEDYRKRVTAANKVRSDRFWHDPEYEEQRKRKVEKMVEENKKRATTQKKLAPLVARGASRGDMVAIYTDLSKSKIRAALRHLPSASLTDEEISEMKRKAALVKHGKSVDAQTPQQKQACLFAKELLESGIIGNDLFFWEELQQIYTQNHRELPDDFTNKIKIEAFLKAFTDGTKTNVTLNRFGQEVDDEWFTTNFIAEKQFIHDVLTNPLTNFTFNLPKTLEGYSSLVKQAIDVINKHYLTLEKKEAFFYYWIYSISGNISQEEVADKLNVNRDKFVQLLKMVREIESESLDWKTLVSVFNLISPEEDE